MMKTLVALTNKITFFLRHNKIVLYKRSSLKYMCVKVKSCFFPTDQRWCACMGNILNVCAEQIGTYAASLITSPLGSLHCGCVTSDGSGASAWQVSTTDLPTATVWCVCIGNIRNVCAEHPAGKRKMINGYKKKNYKIPTYTTIYPTMLK